MAGDISVAGRRSSCIVAAGPFRVEERHREGSRGADQQLGGGMKILVSFPHALGSPGIGWTAWNQVNELVRRGHDVTVVAASVAQSGGRRDRDRRASRSRVAASRIAPIGRDRAFAWHDRVARADVREGAAGTSCTCGRSRPGLTAAAARAGGAAVVREAPNTHTVRAWRVGGGGGPLARAGRRRLHRAHGR